MELGAVDYIAKDLSGVSRDIVKIEKELQDKVKTIAKRKVQAPKAAKVAQDDAAACRTSLQKEKRGMQKRDIVAIGVSTGGPPAVQKLLAGLPEDYPAGVLIAQHMPAAFTGPFAARLNSLCALEVVEAQGGERLGPGKVFIAPGGKHLTIKNMASHMQVVVSESPKEALYKPSVDVLMESVAKAGAKRTLGVVLTGMGSDGKLGVRSLKQGGGRAIAQSDATCVVYGMPKAIVDDGTADGIVDIDDMCSAMIDNLYQ
jgi:two-component system chemotaxis response regulator CheB